MANAAKKIRLNVVQPGAELQSSLRPDGSRAFVHPADVRGRFTRARHIVFFALIAWWVVLPFLRIAGRPALMFDVEQRRFFMFGATLNAQDTWLLFFLLTGVALAIAIVTMLLGRAWCGWSCPQTVFLEGLFRPLERLIEGPREQRMRRKEGPWNWDKTWRKVVKHGVFVLLSAFVAHVFIGYFVALPKLWSMIGGSPAAHPEAFGWAVGLTAIFYGNFARFREQLCIGVCPYGRLQSVLIDQDSLVVGYDARRGEPRGRKHDERAGDCVDCNRCVVVCPTGIDIRNGLQLDCIGCTQCIDACDDIMDKLKRPRGLVRYDSLNGLSGEARRMLRPRLAIYALVTLLWVVAVSLALGKRVDFEANLLRLRGAPFVMEGGMIQNAFTIHLMNKRPDDATFTIVATSRAPIAFVVAIPKPQVEGHGGIDVPIFITLPREQFHAPIPFEVTITGQDGAMRTVSATFLGPLSPGGH